MKWFIFSLIFFFLSTGKNNATTFSGSLEIPDALFSYYAEGKGIPCIVVSGSANVGRNLYPDSFLRHFNLIHANPKDVGKEILPGLTLDKICADFEKVRKELGLDKIAVMGHSMFSVLPLEYALRYPNNISYAVCTGAIPFVTDEYFTATEEYWENEASEERKKKLEKNIEHFNKIKNSLPLREQFIKEYEAYIPYRFKAMEYDLTPVWKGIEFNVDFINHYWNNLLKNNDHTSEFKKIDTPVLVITGKYDFAAPYYLWKELDNAMQNMELVVYENAGHNPMLEIPQKFTNTVVQWIKKQQ